MERFKNIFDGLEGKSIPWGAAQKVREYIEEACVPTESRSPKESELMEEEMFRAVVLGYYEYSKSHFTRRDIAQVKSSTPLPFGKRKVAYIAQYIIGYAQDMINSEYFPNEYMELAKFDVKLATERELGADYQPSSSILKLSDKIPKCRNLIGMTRELRDLAAFIKDMGR